MLTPIAIVTSAKRTVTVLRHPIQGAGLYAEDLIDVVLMRVAPMVLEQNWTGAKRRARPVAAGGRGVYQRAGDNINRPDHRSPNARPARTVSIVSCGLKHQGRFVFTPVLRNSFLELMPMSLPR